MTSLTRIEPAAEPTLPSDYGFDRVFDDDDYLYFYESVLTPERDERETDLIWRLLELEPGLDVLDVPCGYGRIGNRLAERGCRVVGSDLHPVYLDLARLDAERRGVEVEYVRADMRELPWRGCFDRVVNWFTSFGYFADEDNRAVLTELYEALRPGGRLLIEPLHPERFMRGLPLVGGQRVEALEKDGAVLVDRVGYDLVTGRAETERTIVRDGAIRRFSFSQRMISFTELRGWLLDAGFARVEAFAPDLGPPRIDDHFPGGGRLLVVAHRADERREP